uniref:Putative pupal cuticle protein n=1 Tax=Corethrella appendiculata TaxID=1370023 RepID=U5EXP9_9DIPT
MKLVILFLVLSVLAIARSAPQYDDSRNAEILRLNIDNIGVDGYSFDFETSDGISRSEQAEVRNIGTDEEELVVNGVYRYIGPDGVEYVVNFIADRNGFQPQGDHLPK